MFNFVVYFTTTVKIANNIFIQFCDMLPIAKRLLCIISTVALLISCASQENKTSNGDDAPQDETYVRVSPKSELQFPGANSVCSLMIESSGSWEITGANDWCSVSPMYGGDGDRVLISVVDNMLDEERSVNLVVSCGDAEATIRVAQEPTIKSTYVDVGFDNGETISGYNEETGQVTIEYTSNNIPSVAKGSTIVLSDEYMFDVRVVESFSINGDTFTYNTTPGNIWDVFSDTSFTLASDDDVLALNIDGTPVITPVAKGYLNERGEYVEVYNTQPSSTKTSRSVAQAKSAGYDIVADYHASRGYDEHRGGPSPSMIPYAQFDEESYDDLEFYYEEEFYCEEEYYEEEDDTFMCVDEEENELYFSSSRNDISTGVEWNFRRDYGGLDIYNGMHGRLWMEKCAFDAGLSCTFDFKFGDSDSNSFFSQITNLEYFSCQLKGSFGADLLLRYQFNDSLSYSDDKIIKHNVIPTQIYTFVICGVPVHLLIYTHLGQYAEMGLSSGIDASGGVDMGLDMEAGISWSKEDGVKFTKGATPHLTVYPLTLSANTSAYAKVSYYPQIEIGLYGRFGPWFEPRPYIKQEVETGFTLSTGDDYYDSWKSTLYGGLDMRVGLKVDFGFYDKDLWTSKVFSVVDDTPLYTAPKRISLESPSAGDIVVDVNDSVNVSFKVDDYCSITDKYSKCSNAFVTFKANGGTLSKTYDATDSSGIANVSWTPFTSSSDTSPKTLTAYIYDGKGNVIDKATLEVNLKGVDDTPKEEPKEEPKKDAAKTHNGHEYVDLGLPSGIKWATCNVGADSPEESGDYYAWGETATKYSYNYSNCETKDLRIDDIQGTNYDVAYVKWGGGWCMPTTLEFQELIDYCTWIWTTQKGQTGYKVVGPNGNSIFLPAVGARDGDVNKIDDLYGRYWSSSHGARPTTFATFLKFSVNYYETGRDSYFYGLPIRPILYDSNDSSFLDKPCYSNEGKDNGHKYVDLGLPSGLKWATCNVGADSPEEFGDYYAWGEIKPKESYIEDNYIAYTTNLEDISGDVNYDAARANWGGDWRMPTIDEWKELVKNCAIHSATENETKGFKFTSKKNGNSIFIPAAGYNASWEREVGQYGRYWSSTHYMGNTEMAYNFGISNLSDCYAWGQSYGFHGHTIRPVLD